MFKRFTSFLLAFLMVFSLCLPAYAEDTEPESTATTPKLSLSVDNNRPKVGETVTVTISCDTEITGLQSWGMNLFLDKEAYTLKTYEVFDNAGGYVGSVTDYIQSASKVNIMAATPSNKLLTISNGTLATLTFEVTGATTGSFELKNVEAYIPNDDKSVTRLVGPGEGEGIQVIVCTEHSWTDGVCGTCGTKCAHAEYENGACKVCSKACAHSYSEGSCTICGAVDPANCTHTWTDGACTVCKTVCAHTWNAETGVCTTCNTECDHAEYEDSACKVCGKAQEVATPAIPLVVTVNGEVKELTFVTNNNGQNWYFVSVSSTLLNVSGTEENPLKKFNSLTIQNNSVDMSLNGCTTVDFERVPEVASLVQSGTSEVYNLGYQLTNTADNQYGTLFVELVCDHSEWDEASCTTAESCKACHLSRGNPAGHQLDGKGACLNCDTEVPAISATANSKPVDMFYTTAYTKKNVNGVLYMEIYEGSDVKITTGTHVHEYAWADIKAEYQSAESYTVAGWESSYKLPIKNANIINTPDITCKNQKPYEFYIFGVIAHPDHSYVDGECSICGKACTHSWNTETGVCTTCNTECDHAEYENSACKVCGKAEPIPENPITKVEVSHPGIETVIDPETGAEKLTMQIVSGTSEKLNLNITLESTELEPTQQLSWNSDKPDVAWVEDGILKTGSVTVPTTVTLTAIAVEKTALLALTDGEGPAALYTLEVTVNPVGAGYTVAMGEDVENTVIGSTVSIPVTIGHTDTAVTQFSAYDMTFTYDPAVLKLATFGTEITDVKDDNGNSTGTIHVEHYGDKTANGIALTLEFQAVATGETSVKVTAAKVDISEGALSQDAPNASVTDNITLVSVTGYTINLPTDFEGKTSIQPGETYTFEAKDKNYTYDFTDSTMGGKAVTVTELKDENGNGTGKFQIENVSGNIVIASDKTGKTFKVTMNGDGIAPAAGFTSGENAAQYTVDYKAQLAEIDKWNYRYTVTIGGKEYTDYTVKDGVITISGEDITGDIVFTVTRTGVTQDKHQVDVEGATGDVDINRDPEVENGQDYTFTVNKVAGFKYTVTATMDGQPVKVIDNGDGTYTIENVTGVLKINVQKEYIMTVEVVEDYVKAEGKSMFLVLAETAVDTGKVLSYDGTPMFYTTKYSQQTDGEEAAGKWVYLVFTETTLSVEDAKAKITLADVSDSVIKVTLDKTFNVNESGITDGDSVGTVDINDAQLVYDMYNAVYKSFDNGATMQKFLKADVNGDKVVGVDDATAIVAKIISAK